MFNANNSKFKSSDSTDLTSAQCIANFNWLPTTITVTNCTEPLNNYKPADGTLMRVKRTHTKQDMLQVVGDGVGGCGVTSKLFPPQGYENPYIDMYYNPKYSYYSLDDVGVGECAMKCKLQSVEQEQDYYSNSSYRSSEQEGSDNLLVTIDYGYSDSIDEQQITTEHTNDNKDATFFEPIRTVYAIKEENINEIEFEKNELAGHDFFDDNIDDEEFCNEHMWYYAPSIKAHEDYVFDDSANVFQVHRMQHPLKDSLASVTSAFTEYDVDEEVEHLCNGMTSQVLYNVNNFEVDEDDNDNIDNNEMEEEQFYDSIECA